MSAAATSAGCEVALAADGRIQVRGELTFATVSKVRIDCLRLFDKVRNLHIDLGGVVGADSAGLALMIDWMREARLRKRKLHFSRIPATLRIVAELSDVEDLLPA